MMKLRSLAAALLALAAVRSHGAETLSLRYGVAAFGTVDPLADSPVLAACGAEYVEPALSKAMALSPEALSAARQRLKASGLHVETMNWFLPGADIPLTGPNVDRDRIRTYVEKALALAESFGAKVIVFGSPGARSVPEGFPRDKAWEQLKDFLRTTGGVIEARHYGMVIGIEALRRPESNIVNSVTEALRLAREVDHPKVRIIVDFYHLAFENEDPDVILEARDRIVHLQIADPKSRAYPVDATGEPRYARFFANLRRIGYHGRLSVEANSDHLEGDCPAALAFLKGMAASAPAAAGPRVTLDSGEVEGVPAMGGAAAFKGIPYAGPPTGEWRWKPPRPVEPWAGIRDARELGPVCPQPDVFTGIRRRILTLLGGDPSLVPALGPTSEDCLSLNVWTTNLGGKTRQPVLVWLHGGGLRIGSGGEEAATLAPLGVVVVTLNYRLGLLGFLAHPALTQESPHRSSGNYGLLDQIEALRWVRRNIAAFGGDPEKVMVFGHSSGGSTVLQLLGSPLARGLFQRAVSQSGSLDESMSLAEAEAQGQQIAAGLGAPAGDPRAALRAESVEHLLAAAAGRSVDPVTDHWALEDTVPGVLEAGSRDDVPLLVGATANEWGNLALGFPPPKDREGYRALVQKSGGSRTERLLALYPAASDEDVLPAAIRFLTDRDFVCQARYVASRRRGPSWLYLVSTPGTPGPAGAKLGAFHGVELRFLFQYEGGAPLGDAGRRVSEAMRRYWVRFAASGDPNEPGLPEWPAYRGPAPRHLELGDPIRPRAGLAREGCDVFDEAWSPSPTSR